LPKLAHAVYFKQVASCVYLFDNFIRVSQ